MGGEVRGRAAKGQLKVCRVLAGALISDSRKAKGLEAGEGWSWKALRRREVLPSCWRGVSCFPPGARVELMSESLARTDRRHPPRAHTLAWGTEPQPSAQLSSAAGGLLPASKLPRSPATSGRTSARRAQDGPGILRGLGVKAQPGVPEARFSAPQGPVYDERRGLP